MDAVFDSCKISKLHDEVLNTFREHFLKLGYIDEPFISIISESDHTVRFTGSTTNTFKPYLEHKKLIPQKGLFLLQKSLRTQNAQSFLNDQLFPEWGSYFTEIGALVKYEKLDKISEDTINFLKKLGVNQEGMIIKVYSDDADLMNCAKKSSLNLEIDQYEPKLYRHNYGKKNLIGRNFNLAIKNKNTGEYKDIGNIVAIEDNGKPIAAEMGLGISTLLTRIYSLTNSIESSTISKIIPFKQGFRSKLADALSASIVMLRLGIKPAARDKGRILKTYLMAVNYLRKKCGYSVDDIMAFTCRYEELEFGSVSNIIDKIQPYLEDESN